MTQYNNYIMSFVKLDHH